jgi:hypothetical protein
MSTGAPVGIADCWAASAVPIPKKVMARAMNIARRGNRRNGGAVFISMLLRDNIN